MNIKRISTKEMIHIYRKYLKNDFPRAEIKPLSTLVKDMKNGKYCCFTLVSNRETLGYAFLVKNGNDYLLDYLAIVKDKRNLGYGSIMLGYLKNELSGADTIIAEIESPDYSENNEEKYIRLKRQNFYLKNGFKDSGITVKTFGVYFKLIIISENKNLKEFEIRSIYRKHYSTLLSHKTFKNMIDSDG